MTLIFYPHFLALIAFVGGSVIFKDVVKPKKKREKRKSSMKKFFKSSFWKISWNFVVVVFSNVCTVINQFVGEKMDYPWRTKIFKHRLEKMAMLLPLKEKIRAPFFAPRYQSEVNLVRFQGERAELEKIGVSRRIFSCNMGINMLEVYLFVPTL